MQQGSVIRENRKLGPDVWCFRWQEPEVTSCNFTAPIATLGALGNHKEVLLHPNCTQILPAPVFSFSRYCEDFRHIGRVNFAAIPISFYSQCRAGSISVRA
jgi:hypothetical protein